MTGGRRANEETLKQAASDLGPVPELRVLKAHDPILVGRISAPFGLYFGDVVLLGRREPEFYPSHEDPPQSLRPLGLSSVSRAQVEIRWAYGCFHLEPIKTAKLPMRVAPANADSWVSLRSKIVLEPGARLALGSSIEVLLCYRDTSVETSSTLSAEHHLARISSTRAARRVGGILGVQPAAIVRLLGEERCRAWASETSLLTSEAQRLVVDGFAQEYLSERLTEAAFDIRLAAESTQTPRTTFVRLMDRLGIPRAANLEESAIRGAMKHANNNIRLAAEQLGVSANALKRRINQMA